MPGRPVRPEPPAGRRWWGRRPRLQRVSRPALACHATTSRSPRTPGRPPLGGLSPMYDRTRFPFHARGPLGSRDGASDQLANTRRVHIRRLRDADVADNLAFAAQQTTRIGQNRAEVEAEVDPIGMGRGEYERIAGTRRKREVVGDGV